VPRNLSVKHVMFLVFSCSDGFGSYKTETVNDLEEISVRMKNLPYVFPL